MKSLVWLKHTWKPKLLQFTDLVLWTSIFVFTSSSGLSSDALEQTDSLGICLCV